MKRHEIVEGVSVNNDSRRQGSREHRSCEAWHDDVLTAEIEVGKGCSRVEPAGLNSRDVHVEAIRRSAKRATCSQSERRKCRFCFSKDQKTLNIKIIKTR